MPRGYRYVFAALVGWLVLCANNTHLPKDSQQPKQHYAPGEFERGANTIAAAIAKPDEPAKEDRGCEQGDDNRKSDLCAQWKAADAAEEAADWAARSFVATIVGTGLLIWTLWETRQTSRRELRAYVDVAETGFSDGTHIERPAHLVKGVISAAAVIRNSGQTPAKSIIHWSAVTICKIDEENTLVPASSVGIPSDDNSLPAGGTMTAIRVMERKPTAAERRGIKAGTHAVYIYGRVTYRDVFGVSHASNYRMLWHGSLPFPANPSMTFSLEGNKSN